MSTLAATNLKHASSASNNIVLDSSGNVGIGTSSPTARLQAYGTSGTTQARLGTANGYLEVNAFDANPVYCVVNGASHTSAVFGSQSNTPTVFFTNNTERMRIDSSGNVGIGTSSPGNKLDIVSAGSSQIRVKDGVNATAYYDFGRDGTDGFFGFSGAQTTFSGYKWSVNAGSEVMRITNGGNVGIGTSSPTYKLQVGNHNGYNDQFSVYNDGTFSTGGVNLFNYYNGTTNICGFKFASVSSTTGAILMYTNAGSGVVERARIDSSGNFMIGRNNTDFTNNSYAGALFLPTQGLTLSKTSSTNLGACLYMNRATVGDGNLVEFAENAVLEGSISVSGTTVSYNGGHLSRWSQLTSGQRDPALLKGTVLSNLDEMCVWLDEQGAPQPNEQLNKMKISDVEGDPNVAGVFVNWDNDDQTYTDDMNVAMTGDMIIRIAQGVVVQKGDLLMSAGDGTAKPQGDDIRRSKTVAKVTSNHVTCTYADGSYCVPCVLMAC